MNGSSIAAGDPRWILIQRYADGVATADEAEQLRGALQADPALRAAFLDYVHLDAALEAAAALGPLPLPTEEAASVRRGRFVTWRLAAAGLAAAVAVLAVASAMRPRAPAFMIERSEAVRWADGAVPRAAGDGVVRSATLRLETGTLDLRLVPSGVKLTLGAPFEGRFEGPMRLRVAHGRVGADVGPGGIGFTIATDAGEVVDLGTSFAVEADRGGESRVAVFSGQVKVRPGAARQGNAFTTLSEGEAVRFSAVAGLRRWQQVAMAAEAAGVASRVSTAVVATVRDNLGEGELHPFYGVVAAGLRAGSLAFTDKPNPRWAPAPGDPLPAWLDGADLVRTYHQFRHRRDYELVLTLREPATVFVLIDPRQPAPGWLTERFTDTGARVPIGPWQQGMKGETGVDVRADGLPYLTFAVWQAEAAPGEFRFGPPRDLHRNNLALMYGVAVKARAARTEALR